MERDRCRFDPGDCLDQMVDHTNRPRRSDTPTPISTPEVRAGDAFDALTAEHPTTWQGVMFALIAEAWHDCALPFDVTATAPIDPRDDLQAWARFARTRILDRWYRFASFGVASRHDLAKLTVVVARGAAKVSARWEVSVADLATSIVTTISVERTALEAKVQA